MKKKILFSAITLLACNAFGGNEYTTQEQQTPTIESEQKLSLKRMILELFRNGVLRQNDQGDIVISKDGQTMIDELKDLGIFEQMQTNGEVICI